MTTERINALHQIALAAHRLEVFLSKLRDEEVDKDSLASTITTVACLNQVLGGASSKLNLQMQALFQPLLNKLSKALNVDINTTMEPMQVAKTFFGDEGVRLFKYLKSLGYNEYSHSFWVFLVDAIEVKGEELCVQFHKF